MGLCQYVTFAFMHPPYLVRILFGMPSLHLFTFLMFFISFNIGTVVGVVVALVVVIIIMGVVIGALVAKNRHYKLSVQQHAV